MDTPIQNPGRSPETTSAVTATTASVAHPPEFGTFATLRALFNVPRSSAYEMEKEGEIIFVRLRKRGKQRSRVLVDLDSVRAYFKRCAEENK